MRTSSSDKGRELEEVEIVVPLAILCYLMIVLYWNVRGPGDPAK